MSETLQATGAGQEVEETALDVRDENAAEAGEQSLRSAEGLLVREGDIAGDYLERLLDLQHSSRLEHIEAAFRALNKRLVVSVEDAA